MAGFLGGLAGFLLGLLLVGLVTAWPAVILAHCALKLARQWRRRQAEQRPRQPYDDAYQRALWDVATRNGERDALERLRELDP